MTNFVRGIRQALHTCDAAGRNCACHSENLGRRRQENEVLFATKSMEDPAIPLLD